jgi:hypothetical protein
VLSRVPGTDAADFRGYIDAIQGGIILEKLQALKEASKTGASGLGALSEKEGERLAASVAAIKPNMSDKALKDSFDAIEQHASFLRAVADGKDPRDPNVAKQYGLGAVAAGASAPPSGGAGGGDGTSPPSTSNLTDEQTRAYKAFLAANPNPDGGALKTFLTNADAIAKALKQGGGINTTVQDLSYQDKIKQRIGNEDKLGVGDNPATTLATQGGTLGLSDEAAGIGNAAANILTSPFTGKFDPVFSYQFGRDAERQRIQNARDQLGYGGTAIELASGLGSAGPSALAQFTARGAGAAGAASGALSGFGYGEGAGESTTGAGVGALGGYALGRYAPAAVERVLPRSLRPSPQMAPDVARAADAEGVDLIRPMVDSTAISDYGALESNVYSQPIIRGAAGRVRGQIEDRVDALGQGGTALDTEAAGGALQSAGRRFIQRSRGVANQLYHRARNLAGDARFVPEKAIGQVDAEIAALAPNAETNAGEIRFLEGLKNDLSSEGGKTVEELRQLRTSLRGRVAEQNLTATQAEARAIRALDATQQDVAANVPEAASAFKRADTYYRERQTHIDDIIRRITGGKIGSTEFEVSGERAFQRIKAMASPGGDGRRLAALMRDLEPNERQDIAATLASQIGRRAPDEPFSTALFLSQTRKLSPSARRTVFGPDGAQSVENLRLLSRKLEEAEKDINRSRSATVLERQGWRSAARAVISGMAGIGGTAATGSVTGGVAGLAVAGGAMGMSAVRRVLSARAMVNPRLSRWLADAADVSSQKQAQEMTRKLGVIIAREPAIAGELQPIYEMLRQRVSQPLAAEPGTEGNQNE